MILHDMNQSWKPPAGMSVISVRAEGAYLRVEYHAATTDADTKTRSEKAVVVFVNDMGREVMRTENTRRFFGPVMPSLVEKPESTSAWVRFKNGFFMILIGIEEMIICLKK